MWMPLVRPLRRPLPFALGFAQALLSPLVAARGAARAALVRPVRGIRELVLDRAQRRLGALDLGFEPRDQRQPVLARAGRPRRALLPAPRGLRRRALRLLG